MVGFSGNEAKHGEPLAEAEALANRGGQEWFRGREDYRPWRDQMKQ
jgi:hypothetical protein